MSFGVNHMPYTPIVCNTPFSLTHFHHTQSIVMCRVYYFEYAFDDFAILSLLIQLPHGVYVCLKL